MNKPLIGLILAIAALWSPLQARAGIPVIDVAAIAQLVQQVSYWQQQITGMQQQLTQLQQTHSALTGPRGMEQLLPVSELARNYLPPDYGELMRTVQGSSSTYAGLSQQVQSIISANAILSSSELGALNPAMRAIVEQGRQSAALLGATTQGAYQNTGQRFATLQTLIARIGGAQDAKAIQDLQARIQAEQTMLTNEQTKLQSLYQIAHAEDQTRRLRNRERATADIGSARSLAVVHY
jgi:type IV secretion system protein VirB5